MDNIMKKIIDGKAYNTETATKHATVDLKGQKIDERGTIVYSPDSQLIGGHTSLFETRGGQYFLVREVKHGLHADPDFIGGRSGSHIYNHGLIPVTRKEAMVWAESKDFDADKIESIFGKIAEAGEKTGSMLLRLPKGLKAAIDQASEEADQSANAWAMRCLEQCLAIDRREPMELAYIWEIATTQRCGNEIEWDRAKCFAALEKIAQFAERLAENLITSNEGRDGGTKLGDMLTIPDLTVQEIRKEFAPFS
jgi:hypothetical protein